MTEAAIVPRRVSALRLILVSLIGVGPCWATATDSSSESQGAEILPSDTELEVSGAVIGEIVIDNQNIFNTADPGENRRLFRLTNRLHLKTRERVIRQQLIFQPGDRYSRRLLDESERVLRADRYLHDASIRPVRYRDGKVDLVVTTRDLWTLNPGFNFGRSGGKSTGGFDVGQLNVLGTGAAMSLSHNDGIDRKQTSFEISDNHAFGTWTSVDASYSVNNDGSSRRLAVNRPFYALDVRTAGGLGETDNLQIDSLYDRGQVVDQFRDRSRFMEGYAGWSSGLRNAWVRRWSIGATYDEHRFDTAPNWTGATLFPENRKFVYPWVRFELVQDDYVKLHNRDQIGRTEDFYLGTTVSMRVGWADTALGSHRNAFLFQTTMGQGVAASEHSTLLLSATFNSRLEKSELRNAMLDGAVRYYAEQSSKWLLFMTLQGSIGHHLDLDNQLLLGGDNGLRGYPLRYQGGNARALLTIEQRYFSDWYLFRMFRVGGAVFFDAGGTWGTAPLATPSLGLLEDTGFGLRIGNNRFGLGGVIHVDLAFPINADSGIKKVQLLVQAAQQF